VSRYRGSMPDASTDHACPRCHGPLVDRYYGPCPECRAQLRARFAPVARDVDAGRFEPAMHVTPNAVATKE